MTDPTPTSEKTLRVYSNECEWLIAASLEDAAAVYAEHVGSDDSFDPDVWDELEPHATFRIWCDDDGKPCDIGSGTLVSMTAAQWCEQRGRGYLATTEA